jgi:hypothetical protein
LLDAMFRPAIAEQLRRRGHDAIAATERPDLAKLEDPDLFAAAQREERAIVTENVPDFLRLDRFHRQQGLARYGVLLTTDRRFPRHSPGSIGRLLSALDAFLRTQGRDAQATSLVH